MRLGKTFAFSTYFLAPNFGLLLIRYSMFLFTDINEVQLFQMWVSLCHLDLSYNYNLSSYINLYSRHIVIASKIINNAIAICQSFRIYDTYFINDTSVNVRLCHWHHYYIRLLRCTVVRI